MVLGLCILPQDNTSNLTNKQDSVTIKSLVDKYVHYEDDHVRRVRRRIEDHLRKTYAEVVFEVAHYLNINTD